MARRIVWTIEARQMLADILAFYKKRNGNNRYSLYLHQEFKTDLFRVALNPLLGKETEQKGVRYIVSLSNYSLYYRLKKNDIQILVLWDNRQDSERLKRLLP